MFEERNVAFSLIFYFSCVLGRLGFCMKKILTLLTILTNSISRLPLFTKLSHFCIINDWTGKASSNHQSKDCKQKQNLKFHCDQYLISEFNYNFYKIHTQALLYNWASVLISSLSAWIIANFYKLKFEQVS